MKQKVIQAISQIMAQAYPSNKILSLSIPQAFVPFMRLDKYVGTGRKVIGELAGIPVQMHRFNDSFIAVHTDYRPEQDNERAVWRLAEDDVLEPIGYWPGTDRTVPNIPTETFLLRVPGQAYDHLDYEQQLVVLEAVDLLRTYMGGNKYRWGATLDRVSLVSDSDFLTVLLHRHLSCVLRSRMVQVPVSKTLMPPSAFGTRPSNYDELVVADQMLATNLNMELDNRQWPVGAWAVSNLEAEFLSVSVSGERKKVIMPHLEFLLTHVFPVEYFRDEHVTVDRSKAKDVAKLMLLALRDSLHEVECPRFYESFL